MQAVLALARWCGLRIASEVVTLRVSSVDLAADRLLIDDSKRSHRQSRGPPVIRKLPLFSGVRPYLMPLLKRKCNPNDYLLPTLGGQDPQVVGSLLRQRVYRAIDSLGMDRWRVCFTRSGPHDKRNSKSSSARRSRVIGRELNGCVPPKLRTDRR